MAFWDRNKNSNELRVIKTARDKDSINKAAKNGYRPLIKKIEPSDKIRSKYSVIQNKKTGEIEIIGDYRMGFTMDKESLFETVIDWTYYYPHTFNSPFAAYLIPKDIKIGERVFIEDLIEDYIGASWNQGDTYRLESCEAVWNGTDLEIQYDPRTNRSDFIG
ncbi:MAG: hypothetical protein FD155_3238 [Bacteroidetes bacterium]|nr:MAG: hypothetical protein FD155_3238 [Bacteroidota bacterium]